MTGEVGSDLRVIVGGNLVSARHCSAAGEAAVRRRVGRALPGELSRSGTAATPIVQWRVCVNSALIIDSTMRSPPATRTRPGSCAPAVTPSRQKQRGTPSRTRIGPATRPHPPQPLPSRRGRRTAVTPSPPNPSTGGETPGGSQAGSQRPRPSGDTAPPPAAISAAQQHVSPHGAAPGDLAGLPEKRRSAQGVPSTDRSRRHQCCWLQLSRPAS
jgi:hypothetical protein